jgi:hypothetical protein
MTMIIAVVAAIVVLAILAGIGMWLWERQRKSSRLRERFGPEYDRVTARVGDKRQAENVLESHEKRVEKLQIRPLTEDERNRYGNAWSSAQAQFVDDPGGAIRQADRLLIEVMETRGYPMADFDRRAADISVDHPNTVNDYRTAHAIAQRQERGEASTEDLREAMLRYRSLFNELLQSSATPKMERGGRVEMRR